jgi:hypothetical protein
MDLQLFKDQEAAFKALFEMGLITIAELNRSLAILSDRFIAENDAGTAAA